MGAKQEVMASNYEADEPESAVDWDFPPEALAAADKAAGQIAARFEGMVEYDDLYHDALIYMAERPALVRRYLAKEDDGKYLNWRLRGMLHDRMNTVRGRLSRHASIDDEMEAGRL